MIRSSPSLVPQSPRSLTVNSERPLVLVVDPDRSARAVLEVALSRDGFDVWSVESAEQGLGVLRRGRTPDVIVLESDLGGGDGFSFCAELRGNPRTARVPVVLLARPEDQNVANLADVVGVDEYVQKPAFARDVAALVRFELVRHRSAGARSLRFSTRTLPPAHLLRALLTSARSGTLTLAQGAASVAFRDGAIVQARFGDRWGIEGLVRSLALTTHDYTCSLDPVSVSTDFHCSLRDFVAQVLPRLSRWSLLTMRSLPLDAVLAVDFARLAQALPSMPDDINRIVQLFDGKRPVQQVLIDSPFDETLTLEVGTRLYLMGVIGPVAALKGAATAPLQAPKLFEPRSEEAEQLMRQLFEGVVEIRADQVEPVQFADSDWAMVGTPSDLELEDPAGGWTAAALPDAHLTEGLEDDVARKLNAFNVPTIVEPLQRSQAHAQVAQFAQGTLRDEQKEPLQSALRTATGDASAALSAFRDEDPTPPSPARRFTAEDRQDRIVTPVLTPAVTAEPLPLAEATHALTTEGAVVSNAAAQVAPMGAPVAPSAAQVASIAAPRPAAVAPREAQVASMAAPVAPSAAQVASMAAQVASMGAPVAPSAAQPTTAPAGIVPNAAPVASIGSPTAAKQPPPMPVRVVKDDVEAAFFGSGADDVTGYEDTVSPHAAPAPRKQRVGLLLGLAAVAVLVVVGVEWLVKSVLPAAEAPVVAAPAEVVATVVEPVVAQPVEVAPAVEEPAPEAIIDVSEPLADGVRAYQRGEYQKAVSVLEQVVADEPSSVQGWLVLGQARYDLGNAAGARAATERVLQLEPKNAKVHLLLATLAHDANDKAAMRAELERYLELDPAGEHAGEAKALLSGR